MGKGSRNKKQKEASVDSTIKSVTANNQDEKKRNRNIIYLIFFVSFLFYGNTIQNEFAMDDELVTLDHTIVSKGIRGIPQIFTTRYVQNQKQSYEYRPIVLVSYAIEHQFTGGNPHFSHFINILLYALTGVVLFFLLSRLFINFHWILPASVTFLFLIHPIHSEVVASLKNRDELLSFLFTLLTIRAILNFIDKQKIKYIAFGVLFFLLAIMSKKSSLPVVLTLPLILYFFRGVDLKKALFYIITPVVLLYIIRIQLQTTLDPADRVGLFFENPLYVTNPGLAGKIPVAFYSMAYYVKLLILPYPLLVYYGYDQVEIATWSNWLVILSTLVFVSLGIYSLINLKHKNLFIFGFLYFTLNIGPFSNIIPMPGIIAERFAYGASLGFCIMVCYGIYHLMKIPLTKGSNPSIYNKFTYGLMAVGIVSCVYVFQRNKDWKDHLTIYTTDVVKAPNSAKIHALIGGFSMQTLEKNRTLTNPNQKRLTQVEVLNYVNLAKKHFNKAIEIYPDYAACQNNLGTLYYTYIGDIDSAFNYFNNTVKIQPDHVQAHFNMGSYYEIQYGTKSLLMKYFENKMRIDTGYVQMKNSEKYEDYIDKINPIFRISTIAYSDISKKIQQFINASRQSNNSRGDELISLFSNDINNYWAQLMVKNNIDPSQSINPGQNIINVILTTTSTDQNEFITRIKNEINRNYIIQFRPLIDSRFTGIFNRMPDSTDYYFCYQLMKKQISDTKEIVIKQYYLSLFQREEVYPPAYSRLLQLYTAESMWDSLISMNQQLLKTKSAVRKGDAYRIIATSYQNKRDFDKALEYYNLSVSDEEEILSRIRTGVAQQRKSGNMMAASKLNQVAINIAQTIYTIYNSMGVIYQEKNDPEKSSVYFTKANQYKLQ